MKRGFPILLLLVLAAKTGWAGGERTSERFSFSTYRERAGGLTVLVDGYPASFHEQDAYIAVPIAIGWTGTRPIQFTPESFLLVDASGRAYPTASYREVLDGHAKLTFDRTILGSRPLVTGHQFVHSTPVASRFFPAPTNSTRTERVELARFTWFRDVLYFPNPGPAALRGVLALRVSPGGPAEPIEVRFRVPGLRASKER
jgi:hypothetical protein